MIGTELPLTPAGFYPTKREPKYLLDAQSKPRVHYMVNDEVTLKRRHEAELNGRDPAAVPVCVVEIGTTVALQQARAASWTLSQNGETLGERAIFRDATPDEIADYKRRKEEAIAARNEEVARDEMRNAPKVIVQNIGQPLEAVKRSKEEAIAARNEEVARDEMRNAPKAIVQNIGQPQEAAKRSR